MPPAPISILEHSPFLGNDNFNRYSIGSRDIDQKIVGGHLPLAKRNSTPTGPATNYQLEMLTALLCPTVNRLEVARTLKSSLSPSYDTCNSHRRLDRSHSEPMRPQIQVQPQQQPNGQSGSSRYKTELCRPFGETGYCKYGEKCQFAHGKKELRNMTRHPKYKTELCRTFHTTGLCGYGSRCHFIHNAEERRGPMSPSNGLSTPSPSPSHLSSLSSQVPTVQSSPFISSDDSVFGLTPPSSHNGTPTSNTGLFFDTPYESLVNPVKDIVDSSFDGIPSTQLDLTPPGTPSHDVIGETELEKQRRLDIFVNISNPQK